MSKRKKNFKKVTKLRGGYLSNRVLQDMDDFFKEESERFRRMRKK